MSHSKDKGKSKSHDKKKPHLSIKEKRRLKRDKTVKKPLISENE